MPLKPPPQRVGLEQKKARLEQVKARIANLRVKASIAEMNGDHSLLKKVRQELDASVRDEAERTAFRGRRKVRRKIRPIKRSQ